MLPNLMFTKDEDNVEHQSEVHPPSHSCNKGQQESDSSSSQNQDVNHQVNFVNQINKHWWVKSVSISLNIESLTKRNDELEIENGLLYTQSKNWIKRLMIQNKNWGKPMLLIKVARGKEKGRVTSCKSW
jgi:hypothetical protein